MTERITRRQAAKAQTRAKLIEAARQGFSAVGYHRLHIRDIAATVGMSTGAVFSNFADKDALFEAAMGRPPPDVAGFLNELSALASTAEIGDRSKDAGRLLLDLLGEEGVAAFADA